MLPRLSGWLSGLWAGVLVAIVAIAAPSAFAVLDRAQAGLVARRLFMIEAHLAVALALALFMVERLLARRAARETGASLFNANMVLLLGALFCTVAGYFALEPMLEAARAGKGPYSFGALHAAASALYALKMALVLVLAWRTTAR
jgi:hypothetical protein